VSQSHPSISRGAARDAAHMRRALALAARAIGRTRPNPPVGAVLVRDGVVVGEGHTAPAGGPHAEIAALAAAGEAARGATLYVTLEPCAHHGRTPPCVEAILGAGVAAVRAAATDPNPDAGGGLAALAAAGLDVALGPCRAVAAALLAPFARHVGTGRPLVTAKYAMSLDGRIATRTGHARWITGPAARRRAHALRDASDAVLVGAGTVRADDPALTTRDVPADRPPNHPLRVVLHGRGTLPLAARVFAPDLPGRTLLATAGAPARHVAALERAGVEVLRLPADAAGRLDLDALLDALGAREVMSLLVEGGATVLGAFLDAGRVDRVVAFVAPRLIGGAAAPAAFGGRGIDRMSEARELVDVRVERAGADLVVTGSLAAADAAPGAAGRTADSRPGPARAGAARRGAAREAATSVSSAAPATGGGPDRV